MAEQYTTVPRTVTAAQWHPTDRAAAADVVELAYGAGSKTREKSDGRLVVTTGWKSITLQTGDWLVHDGDLLERYTDEGFRAEFRLRRSPDGARNEVHGDVAGTLFQTGGDVQGDINFS
ncbi:hypothetical protein PWG71_15790 [Nocardiopsis sp. N85]|uniref:hypothetical protein n=1 Tax=Nocardiopsis sp. N85 TaxID=3029400 RepID=UPI00237F7FBD|nr:hypothetical protein [Nocardiopsis sp. N85]MDE3722851.1 hypothetical protein [Nocardiopsis sp. N85]